MLWFGSVLQWYKLKPNQTCSISVWFLIFFFSSVFNGPVKFDFRVCHNTPNKSEIIIKPEGIENLYDIKFLVFKPVTSRLKVRSFNH